MLFLKANYPIKTKLAWIGLNDIVEPGNLVWLEENRKFKDFK